MKLRNEWKHEISFCDLLCLRQRLAAIAVPDEHGANGRYCIRSLYFDSLEDKALREKLDGVGRREKFRLRYYGGDSEHIQLEKKVKFSGPGAKLSAPITPDEVNALLAGDTEWMSGSPHALIRELRNKMLHEGLRPRSIVDYTREAFTFAPGNVRITLDYNIRIAPRCTDFLDPSCPSLSPPGNAIILEVKWDEFLPDIIRDAVQLPGRRSAPFSKYAASRIFDH